VSFIATERETLELESLPDRERLVDVGRVCVWRLPIATRGSASFAACSGGPGSRCGAAATEACGSVTIEMARLYAKPVGSVVLLAPSRTHWGQRRFAARVTPAISPTLATGLGPEDGEHLVGVGDPRLQAR